jgi:uncharacterized membrane protein YedE/YeeE
VIHHLLTVVLGLAFGVVLQRGGFCGSALLSSAWLYKDRRGLLAAGVAIGISMAGFAALVALGQVVPNPSPMRLASAVVGGLVFGVGMVLAGGCVTGTLFKAGEGSFTSMLALVGIGIGVTATDHGALSPLKSWLVTVTREVRTPTGLHDLLGLSYELTAAVVALLLLLALGAWHVTASRVAGRPLLPPARSLVNGAWPAVVTGTAVGVLGWLAYLLSSAMGRNFPLGATQGVGNSFHGLVGGELPSNAFTMLLVAGALPGAALSARLRKGWKLRSADPETLLFALLGGLLVGIGASFGRGCFIGNMVSGVALLSLHSVIFAAVAVFANWATTIVYLRGLR